MAGGKTLPFDAAGVRRIHRHSGGVPRLINILAERALMAGYVYGKPTVDDRLIDMAAREALPPVAARKFQRWLWPLAAALLLTVSAFAVGRSDWLRGDAADSTDSQGASHVADP